MPSSAIAEIGLPASSPQSVTGVLLRSAGAHDIAQNAQKRLAERIESVRNPRISAIDRHRELEEVVRSDRDEIDRLHQLVELPEQCRHLQHRAELQLARQTVAEAREMLHFLLQQFAHHLRFRKPRSPSAPSASARCRPLPSASREAASAAVPAGRATAGLHASRAPDFLPRGRGNRAPPCRRQYRACGR